MKSSINMHCSTIESVSELLAKLIKF